MMIIVEKRKGTINKVSNIREVPTKMMFKKNKIKVHHDENTRKLPVQHEASDDSSEHRV